MGKPLTVRPLKSSQTVGAVLAMQGMANAMPLLHGSQGCSAFTKVLFVRHFREPIPVQTTAMEQSSTIMGADDNLMEALVTLSAKSGAEIIGVIPTGLAATQGSDIRRVIRGFRQEHPQWNEVSIIPIDAPDTTGSLESGFALAVAAMIEQLPTPKRAEGASLARVNVLVGSSLTPGDLEELRDLLGAFTLEVAFLPDISNALDGHLGREAHRAVTGGGTGKGFFDAFDKAMATLVIGRSLFAVADGLRKRSVMPVLSFEHLMGLDATDELVTQLCFMTRRAIPARVDRWRRQMLDAMLDAHFHLGEKRVALAGERDLVAGFHDLLAEMGSHVVAAVIPHGVLHRPDISAVVGDLDDLETLANRQGAELLIGNSHLDSSASKLGIPLHLAGYPIFDRLGEFRRCRIGYRGGRDTLFALANLMLARPRRIVPYRSTLRACFTHSGAMNHDARLVSNGHFAHG
ncbi:MAG: nitrogenase iron-molybdenum cofactor biosynthesis protein NifN [Magnetococcales bacterium]|nr:nitrogenase iron-molybdenum cofactor biosynthesis protein NifN [Magnetococcales bacterium]